MTSLILCILLRPQSNQQKFQLTGSIQTAFAFHSMV
ncbi:hypothetical protein EVA_20067 [gut metagenome]|uniref:Uncharacterized protein n=1 Tax=gut metagenome TaxID=749906 RepID=J9FQG5_9ZZZZ